MPALVDSRFRVVTYDRRGHGRSDVARDGYDLDTLADDIVRLVEHLALADPVLVGHSLGAAEVARAVTKLGSQHVAGVVLSAPNTPSLRRSADNPMGIEDAVFEAAHQAMRQDIGSFVSLTPADTHFGANHSVSPAVASWTSRQIIDTPLSVLLATQRTVSRLDVREDLVQMQTAVLVIQGDADASTPIDLTGRPTAALVENGRLVVIEGAGHALYLSHAPSYNSELIAFAETRRAVTTSAR